MTQDDPFGILGVEADADDGTIRRAYHRLAMQWHPDKNQSNPVEAAANFTRVHDAYSILSDPAKRSRYLASVRIPTRCSSAGFPVDRGSFDHLYEKFYGAHDNRTRDAASSDEFGRVIGRASSYPADTPLSSDEPSAVDTISGLDVKVIVTCTLEEMYNCASKTMSVSRRRENGQFETKPVKITLTLGLEDHTQIVLAKQGHREKGQTPGDLVFLISQVRHSYLIRDGDDVIQKVTISLKDAISGSFVLRAVAVDGEEVSVALKELIQPGQDVKVVGRGMRRKDGSRGDHIFRVGVIIPILSQGQIDQILEVIDFNREKIYNINRRSS